MRNTTTSAPSEHGEAPDDLRAIVRPSEGLRRFTPQRWAPAAPLDRLVDRIWKTSWRLDGPFTQAVVGFPVVNLVCRDDGRATVTGPLRQPDRQRLEGEGWALGVMFRPGGFRPLLDGPAQSLLDRRQVPVEEVLGPGFAALGAAVAGAGDDEGRVALLTERLAALVPAAVTVGEQLSELLERAAAERPPVTNVAVLADRFGVSVRTLQRLFAEHVGAGPKMALDRYRLQLAGEAARRPVRNWAEVAHRLGYADQAHLSTDLRAGFGAPPAAYARAETAE